MQHVALDSEKKTIAFHRPGMSVNLNSMGKGYALDRMAELLAQHDIDDYLLHGGKSSVLARGNQPGSRAPAGASPSATRSISPKRLPSSFYETRPSRHPAPEPSFSSAADAAMATFSIRAADIRRKGYILRRSSRPPRPRPKDFRPRFT